MKDQAQRIFDLLESKVADFHVVRDTENVVELRFYGRGDYEEFPSMPVVKVTMSAFQGWKPVVHLYCLPYYFSGKAGIRTARTWQAALRSAEDCYEDTIRALEEDSDA